MPRQPHIGILVAAIYADIKVKILFENYYINENFTSQSLFTSFCLFHHHLVHNLDLVLR